MVTDGSVPWYNRPPREFPVHVWMRRRYGFTLPPLSFAPPAHTTAYGMGRRPFPAQVWLEGRQAGD